MRATLAALLLAALAAASCFKTSSLDPCTLRCSPEGECPTGYDCVAGMCGGPMCAGERDGPPPQGDAAPDATFEYVLTAMTLPTGATADQYAFDLDGVGDTTDNRLGGVLDYLPGDKQGTMSGLIEGGELVLLHAAGADSWGAWVGTPTGQPIGPDMSFTIQPGSPSGSIAGATTGGVFSGRDGVAPLALPLGEGVPPVVVALHGAAIEAEVTETGFSDPPAGTARLGGGVRMTDFDNIVLPALATASTSIIQGDRYPADGLPDCTCAAGMRTCQVDGNASQTAALFDANNDCMVLLQELRDTPFLLSVTQPDVDLFDAAGNYNPGTQGDAGFDSLSYGVGIGGVRAMFPRPGE